MLDGPQGLKLEESRILEASWVCAPGEAGDLVGELRRVRVIRSS